MSAVVPSVSPESGQTHPAELPTTEMVDPHLASLSDVIEHSDAEQASKLLAHESNDTIAQVLDAENPAFVDDILEQFPEARRTQILEAGDQTWAEQWRRNQ